MTWSSSNGGSGAASGTTSWTISSISLSSGSNTITVSATDGAGNTSTDTITVTYNQSGTPTPTPTSTTATPKIAAGYDHSLALKSDGTVMVWGRNDYGQLGDGTTTNRSTPVQVSGLSSITAIAGGWLHSLALKTDGSVWACGHNNYGQLGDGTYVNKTTFTQVSGLSNVAAIAGRESHSIALKSDGTVWMWGRNDYGQLGDGTTSIRTSPVQVNGFSNITYVASGWGHSLALKSDGTVWTWGYNNKGQLGDGTTTNRNTPVQVSSLSDVTTIAAGGEYSLALKSDGTVWAWGNNENGTLGNGTTTNQTSPIQVSNLSSITAIAAGCNHCMALKSDGTIWIWGNYNWTSYSWGVSFYYRLTPVQFTEISNIYAISAGWHYLITLKSDSTVWTWGANWYGQLGDGTTQDRSSPVQVDIDLGNIPDTTSPEGSISINGGSVYTNSTTADLTLSATDNVGVTGYYLSTDSSTPSASSSGWATISSTTSYSASVSYTLSGSDGNKIVYVWYKDNAGNISDAANDSIILDTAAPTVTITSPTSDSAYTTTSAIINIGGSASDSVSGLNSIIWSNDRGGVGTADGITSWYISDINLAGGDNTITVTVTDGAGNRGTDTITVIYETPTQTPIITPTPITTLPPIQTPQPTPFSDICSAESIEASSTRLFLKRKQSGNITITVSGEDDCPVEGEKAEALVNAAGKKYVTILPTSQETDENGEATFRITAKNKIGIARVTFSAGGFKKSITVKVKR